MLTRNVTNYDLHHSERYKDLVVYVGKINNKKQPMIQALGAGTLSRRLWVMMTDSLLCHATSRNRQALLKLLSWTQKR
jgi:hypothetical protein